MAQRILASVAAGGCAVALHSLLTSPRTTTSSQADAPPASSVNAFVSGLAATCTPPRSGGWVTTALSSWLSGFVSHARSPAPLPPVAPKPVQPDTLLYYPTVPPVPTDTTGAPAYPPLPTLSSTLSAGEQAAALSSAAAYGLPSLENVVIRGGYIASVNYRTRVPNWVLEHYCGKTFSDAGSGSRAKAGAAAAAAERDDAWRDASDSDAYAPTTKVDRKTLSFRADASVPPPFRAVPSDYARSGLSRGHLAPAAAHSTDELACFETFLLSTNIVPQNAAMNRGDWLKLERFTRSLSNHFTNVRVVTGPLYLPETDATTGRTFVRYEVIGKTQVAVPSHLFKVVYCEDPRSSVTNNTLSEAFSRGILIGLSEVSVRGTPSTAAAAKPVEGRKGGFFGGSKGGNEKKVLVAAFVMPNTQDAIDRPLSSYMVPIKDLESMSGLFLTPRAIENSVTMATVRA